MVTLGLIAVLIYSNINYKNHPKYTYLTSEELKRFQESSYNLCYAHYWDAYGLEYLSGGNVEFIVHDSQDRTKKINAERKSRKIEKCLYTYKENKILPFE